MELETVLRKYVRMPWEVWTGTEHFKDREISDYVNFEAFAGDAFKNAPNERQYNAILQSIASAMTIALVAGTGDELSKRNRFPTLLDEEKKFIFRTTGINPVEHDSVLFIVQKEKSIQSLASYIAAAYAFTTWTKPFVASFEKITAVAFQSLRDGSKEEKAMRTAGLLIVTDFGMPTKTNDTAYAFLKDLLTMRAMRGRINMFIDTPSDIVLQRILDKKIPTRQDVVSTYVKMFPPQYRLHNLLVGAGVHIPMIDKYTMTEGVNESRKAVVI